MSNWKDKYDFLKPGESAWYWHIDKNTYWKWTIVKVSCGRSKQDDCDEIYIEGTSYYSYLVSEDFPNGPRCLTPEEIEKLLASKEEAELPNEKVYQELENSIMECKVPTPMPEWLEKQLDIVSDTVSKWSENKKRLFRNDCGGRMKSEILL